MGLFDGIMGGATAGNGSGPTDPQTQANPVATGDSEASPIIIPETQAEDIVTPITPTEPAPAIDIGGGGIFGTIESSDAGTTPSEAPTTAVAEQTNDVIVPTVDAVTPQDALLETSADAEAIPASTSILGESATKEDGLDERIEEFIADLNRIKEHDSEVVQEKKDRIHELDEEKKQLEKEVRQMQAEEKRIDTTIDSLHNKDVGGDKK